MYFFYKHLFLVFRFIKHWSKKPASRFSTIGVSFFVVLLVISSCSKDTVEKYPRISIAEPLENQLFEVFDSIPVKADIMYEDKISTVIVRLTDNNFNSILPAVYHYPNSTEVHLEFNYPIDDAYLEDNTYYLQIMAESNGISKNQYRKILVKSIPREFKEVVVITQPDATHLQVSAIDSTQTVQSLFLIKGDFASSELSSKQRQIYIAGKSLTNIVAFNLETNTLAWSIQPQPPIPMHAFNCLYYDESLYASFSYLWITGYNQNGSLVFNTSTNESSLPSKIFRFNDLLLADLQNKNGGSTYLATYYTVTGVEKQKLFTLFKVVDFQTVDDKNCLILANNVNGDGEIFRYNPYSNVLTLMKSLEEPLITSVMISSSHFLIGTQSKITEFVYPQGYLNPVLPGESCLRMDFDTLSEMLYITGPHTIKKIKYPEMIYQNLITLPDSILNFHLFYNK